MKDKKGFWKLLLILLLFSMIAHWKDVKAGFCDAWNDGNTIHIQNMFKK